MLASVVVAEVSQQRAQSLKLAVDIAHYVERTVKERLDEKV